MEFLLYLFTRPFGYMLEGFVLVKLWHWFVVPQFHVAELTIPIALGLACIVGLLTTDLTVQRKEISWMELATYHAVACLMIFGVGALIHLFI